MDILQHEHNGTPWIQWALTNSIWSLQYFYSLINSWFAKGMYCLLCLYCLI